MLFEFVALMSVLLLIGIVFLVMRLSSEERRREEAERRGY
jgi:flagellar biogenesis protein FliO